MGNIDVNTASSHLYGSETRAAPSVTANGDVKVSIKETVAAGATETFGAAFAIAEMQNMSAHIAGAPEAFITDGTDTFLAAGLFQRLWTLASGETNPLTGPLVTGITVDNSGGSVEAVVKVDVLIENP